MDLLLLRVLVDNLAHVEHFDAELVVVVQVRDFVNEVLDGHFGAPSIKITYYSRSRLCDLQFHMVN